MKTTKKTKKTETPTKPPKKETSEFDALGLNGDIIDQATDDIKFFQETMNQEVEPASEDEETELVEGAESIEAESIQDIQFDKEDEVLAKGALEMLDETRALWLSSIATGDIDSVDRFLYYKDLDKGRHKLTVRAAAQLAQQYRLGQSPLIILLVSLAISTFVMWKRAKKDKKQRIANEKASLGKKGNAKSDTPPPKRKAV